MLKWGGGKKVPRYSINGRYSEFYPFGPQAKRVFLMRNITTFDHKWYYDRMVKY
jgi:hypothetical protein